jgi:fructokinase
LVVSNFIFTFATDLKSYSPRHRRTKLKKNMKNSALVLALMEIATANPDGFTVNAQTLQPITKGYAVALADTQNSHDTAGLLSVIDYAQNHADTVNAIGGWLDTESNKFYFDATVICDDLETALILGRRNNQIAIFDLEKMEEIRL